MPRKSRTISSRPSATFAGVAQRTAVEFNPDYTNVKRDLKRIGTLAGIFFALMIVLAFVLPYTPFGR
jgi:hypothetical protein